MPEVARTPQEEMSSPNNQNPSSSSTPVYDSGTFIDPKKAAALIKTVGLMGTLKPFGSYTSGLITKSSDLDVMYERHPDEKEMGAAAILQKFFDTLPALGFCNFVTVFQASLPLLKLIDCHGVDIDICVDNQLGYWNSLLMGSYARVDRRVPDFIRRIKCFAKRYEIVGSTDGHLNSYAWTLMAVYFLMHATPCPVVPNLQALAQEDARGISSRTIQDSRWGEKHEWEIRFFVDIQKIPPGANTSSLDDLCAEFFSFYATKFDWDKAVSIRLGLTEHDSESGVNRLKLSDFILNQKDPSGWWIEDPFDLCHNLAGSCTSRGKERILTALKSVCGQVGKVPVENLADVFSKVCPVQWRAPWLFLKCRVNLEKITEEEFVTAFREIQYEDAVFVWFPKLKSRVGGQQTIFDAFIQFKSDRDRKKAHTKSESYVGSWQIRLLYCCRGILGDVNQEHVKYCRVPLTRSAAERAGSLYSAMNTVSDEVLKSMKHIEVNEPRIKNFAALNHLYRISQNQIEQIRKSSEKTTQVALERNPRLMHKLGMTMSTVSYLLGIMDSDFLEQFLQDPRNEPLIRQLKGLHQQYQTRLFEIGHGPPPAFLPKKGGMSGPGAGSPRSLPQDVTAQQQQQTHSVGPGPGQVTTQSALQSVTVVSSQGKSSSLNDHQIYNTQYNQYQQNTFPAGPTPQYKPSHSSGGKLGGPYGVEGAGKAHVSGPFNPQQAGSEVVDAADKASKYMNFIEKTFLNPKDKQLAVDFLRSKQAKQFFPPERIHKALAMVQQQGAQVRQGQNPGTSVPLVPGGNTSLTQGPGGRAPEQGLAQGPGGRAALVPEQAQGPGGRTALVPEQVLTQGPGGRAALVPETENNHTRPVSFVVVESLTEKTQEGGAGLTNGNVSGTDPQTLQESTAEGSEGDLSQKEHNKYLTPAQMETFLRDNPTLVQAALANPKLLASFMDPKVGTPAASADNSDNHPPADSAALQFQ